MASPWENDVRPLCGLHPEWSGRITDMVDIEFIKEKFKKGEYAVSAHAIIEARKDGIEPDSVRKLEWVAINGKIVEEYPDRERILLYATLEEDELPVHVVIDYSLKEEPVIVTGYVPDSRYWIKFQIRKK
jgi:hypothetical protein